MNARILIVEDERGVALVVSDLLRAEGHTVEVASDGTEGLRLATNGDFDLVILDIMLPGISGLQICENLRQRGFPGAILMLTARSLVRDRVEGLDTGADDYLVKPFDPKELLARVVALLRRLRKQGAEPVTRIEFGSVVADFASGEFSKAGQPVKLAAKESELLRYLVNNPGRTLTREAIITEVWKQQQHITSRTVDVHIAWLRQMVEEKPEVPRYIITVRGEGYRFDR